MATREVIEDLPTNTSTVSVVVVAREGYAKAHQKLRQLLESTQFPFKLVYVDGGAPFSISSKLKRTVLARYGTFVRAHGFLKPTRARNLGFQQVDTT